MTEYKKAAPQHNGRDDDKDIETFLHLIIFYCNGGNRSDECMEHMKDLTRKAWDLIPESVTICNPLEQENHDLKCRIEELARELSTYKRCYRCAQMSIGVTIK